MKKIIEWIIILIGCLASGCYVPEEEFVPINDYYVKLQLGGFLESQGDEVRMETLKYFKLYGTEYYVAVHECLDDDNYSHYYRIIGSMQKVRDTVIFLYCPVEEQVKESISLAIQQ